MPFDSSTVVSSAVESSRLASTTRTRSTLVSIVCSLAERWLWILSNALDMTWLADREQRAPMEQSAELTF